MKKLAYLFTISLFVLLLSSCSKDETAVVSSRFVSNISLSKQNAFVNDQLTLTFDTNNSETTTVVSENSNIILTPVSPTSYKISSTKVATGLITITTTKGDKIEKDQVQVIFNAHGTTDYQVIEGIDVGVSKTYTALLLLGKPDVEVPFTVSTTNATTGVVTTTKYISWYYLSKGISMTIIYNTYVISDLTIYATAWQVVVGEQINQGISYPQTIGTVGNFTTGILMDNVITKFLVPAAANKLTTSTANLFGYRYTDLNTTLTGTQSAIFYFNTDLIDVYQGKSVNKITFY